MITPSGKFHEYFMRLALREAEKSAECAEVPAGCVIVEMPKSEELMPASVRILARAHNQTEMLKDATAHAEMIALTQAAEAKGDWRLNDTILYVTKEPCPMCAGAIVLSRVSMVVWGISDPKRGGQTVFSILNHPGLNHRPEIVSGVSEAECLEIMQSFFRRRRADKKGGEQ